MTGKKGQKVKVGRMERRARQEGRGRMSRDVIRMMSCSYSQCIGCLSLKQSPFSVTEVIATKEHHEINRFPFQNNIYKKLNIHVPVISSDSNCFKGFFVCVLGFQLSIRNSSLP